MLYMGVKKAEKSIGILIFGFQKLMKMLKRWQWKGSDKN